MVAILLEIRDGKDDRMRVEGVYNLEIAHLFLYGWNRRVKEQRTTGIQPVKCRLRII